MKNELAKNCNEFLSFTISHLKTSFSQCPIQMLLETLLQFNLTQKLRNTLGKEWKHIYKASKQRFESSTSHQKYDNEGSILTIIQANGHIFG
jgi:hypothetical protein